MDNHTPVPRRTVAKGIAWATPTIALATAAPAMAASSECVPLKCGTATNPATGTIRRALQFDGTNWGGGKPAGTTWGETSANVGALSWWETRTFGGNTSTGNCPTGYCGATTPASRNLIAGGDPPKGNASAAFNNAYSANICLAPGTYTFSFDYGAVQCEPGPETIVGAIWDSAGKTAQTAVKHTNEAGSLAGATRTPLAATSAALGPTTVSFSYTTRVRKSVYFMFSWTYGNITSTACPGNTNWNDIWVTQPRVTSGPGCA